MSERAPIHVSVDVETLGTAPGSVILSIGAVAFTPGTDFPEREKSPTFERWIDPTGAMEVGLKVDADTLIWWMQQDDEARRINFDRVRMESLYGVLYDFSSWLGEVRGGVHPFNFCGARSLRIWGHGASFDVALLEAAFRAVASRIPWSRHDIRDTRTLFEVSGIQGPEGFRLAADVKHTALGDALAQARAICAGLAAIEDTRAAATPPAEVA